MNIRRFLPVLLALLLTSSAWAQSPGKPLNLKLSPGDALPPSDVPAAGASAPATAATSLAANAPGVYYGDTSGRMGNTGEVARAPACDDSTYNQAQMHGSVGMGVVGGNHVSGNYQTGAVAITKNLGDCDHRTGTVGFSINVDQGNFHDGYRGH
ncbi:MAG: hypothetical protein EPN69_06370 [Rhodanobacter sp.]|nr:MAG: hypothetical protein EPN69_06370 [Rhodanobacter sp.]TAL99275.1 MAG: hypothetical protein EPN71_07850 [Rhodanobacter sp.]TAM42680.1 MAG: hypothetical protein EPN58_02105 [Rhodanobacter sp.]TAN26804.1 MAG: hypothetical protein EPN32_06135 [Rhodanobacter sp.]